MQLKQQHSENGNGALHKGEIDLHLNYDNRSWLLNSTAYGSDNQTNNTPSNSKYCSSRTISKETESSNLIRNDDSANLNVCNQQYRLDSDNHNGLAKLDPEDTQTGNLEGTAEFQFTVRECFLGDAPFSPSPLDEERVFQLSDTDEMSEVSHPVDPVPRGIVNPNYPGFQHLAHTLQNYSTNIDNCYLSENDMTDDDIDITDISENNYDAKININEHMDTKINNNNISLSDESFSNHLDVPDLLKTISHNNNNNILSQEYETACLDPDIDNNFDTKDIIGNFNKEIEDEIKQLLNYNINIQNDLDELRQDIKDTLAKPIQNTINNISDVVNHVIKKLVEIETQSGGCHVEIDEKYTHVKVKEENENAIEENETNSRKEMSQLNISRPTFLFLQSNSNVIPDAVLSDGTDEINIDEDNYKYAEILSDKLEKTVTKLRNVIPTLDEELEDKLTKRNQCKIVPDVIITDGNSNEIASTSCIQSDEVLKSHYIGPSDLKLHENPSCSTKPVVSRVKAKTKSNKSDKTKKHLDSSQDLELECFDVYNIETALPKLDFDTIESHLKAAREAERRKHNDREEIRRRLAAGVETEEYHSLGHGDRERPGRKPSLHSRLQSGKNLQICYMNETASDNESQPSDVEKNLSPSKSLSRSSIFSKSNFNHPYQTKPLSVNITKQEKLSTSQSAVKHSPVISRSKSRSSQSLSHNELRESDFYALQATLQTEARIALAQAKELARIQMERSRQSRAVSPVTAMLRHSMEKANAPLAADRRRVSRQLLTDMNVAQLQVIVNELHSQVEALNESLVSLLMERDELHMGQDSMLVDIEDLTRYLGVKEQMKKSKGIKSGVRRLPSFVKK